MSRKLSKVLATAAVATAVVFGFAGAQQSEAANAAQLREQVNRGTVGIVAGDMHSATVRMSKDLATILDDGDNRRVLTVVGKGSAPSRAPMRVCSSTNRSASAASSGSGP